MSFLATHKRNILERTSISYNQIEPGDILEFRYKGKSGSALKLVIALNIFPLTGNRNVKKLHAMSLPELSINVFKRFIGRLGKPALELDERKNKEVIKLIVEGGKKGNVFYDKVASKFNKENAYRTFNISNITSIKLVEYNYGIKQLGLKNEDLLQDTDA